MDGNRESRRVDGKCVTFSWWRQWEWNQAVMRINSGRWDATISKWEAAYFAERRNRKIDGEKFWNLGIKQTSLLTSRIHSFRIFPHIFWISGVLKIKHVQENVHSGCMLKTLLTFQTCVFMNKTMKLVWGWHSSCLIWFDEDIGDFRRLLSK